MVLNKTIITKVFQGVVDFLSDKYGENNFSLTSFNINSPCGAEDNFMSEIYSVHLETTLKDSSLTNDKPTQKQINLIVKSQIIDSEEVERYYYTVVFTKEMLMYSKILPRMKLLSEELGNPYPSLSPKLHQYYTEGESYSCLLMDNLVSEGFYIPQTHGDGVTLEECKSIMKATARFHALSLVIEGQEGSPLPEKNEICCAEFLLADSLSSQISPVVKSSYEGLLKLAEKFRPDLVPSLVKLEHEESCWKRLCALVKPGTTTFSCLCHGDPRLNNIFLHKEDITNVQFIDFQLTRYCSPLTDLQYILQMGSTKEFRDKYTDHVLQAYFEEFSSVLASFPSLKLLPEKEAAVRGWTAEKLKEEYEQMTLYGFLIAMTLLPLILLQNGDLNQSVGEMTKSEREKFFVEGKRDFITEIGSKRLEYRKRLLDICDDTVAYLNKN